MLCWESFPTAYIDLLPLSFDRSVGVVDLCTNIHRIVTLRYTGSSKLNDDTLTRDRDTIQFQINIERGCVGGHIVEGVCQCVWCVCVLDDSGRVSTKPMGS